MSGSKLGPYDAISDCLLAQEPRKRPAPRPTDSGPCGSACQCAPSRPWYARGQAIFALVTYVAALTWATLILMGKMTPWAWFCVGLLALMALAYAYGSDGKGGAL